jgi:hypothetical protein
LASIKAAGAAPVLTSLDGWQAFDYSRDGSVTFPGENKLRLSCGGGLTSYALYSLSRGDKRAGDLELIVQDPQGAGYWIGLSDFTRQSWAFNGPFFSSRRLDLNTDKCFSTAGRLYVAVILAPRAVNTYLTINSLSLETAVRTGPNIMLEYDPISGAPPLTVNFDASGTTDLDGEIVSYEWDVDGDGAYDTEPTLNPKLTLTFESPGEHSVRVRVTDDRGLIREAYSGHYEEGYGGPGPGSWKDITVEGWTVVHLDRKLAGRGSLAVINGCPAIAASYSAESDQYPFGYHAGLQYVRCTTPYGASATDWPEPVTLERWVAQTDFPSLTEINGKPAISYAYGDRLHYAAAASATGMEPADWRVTPIQATYQDEFFGTCLREVAGNPAFCAARGSNGCAILYARAASPLGAEGDWGDVLTLDEGRSSLLAPHALQIVNGNPAVAYTMQRAASKDVCYMRALTDSGSALGDWERVTIGTAGSEADVCALGIVGGTPAIVYARRGLGSGVDAFYRRVTFAHALTLDGGNLSDWAQGELTGNTLSPFYPDMATVAGRPVMEIGGAYWAGLNFDGTQRSDWAHPAIVPERSSTWYSLSIVDVNGKVAILLDADTYAILWP